MSYWQDRDDHILLWLKVRPNGRATEFGDVYRDVSGQDYLRLMVTETPENGKANKAILKFLAKSLKCPKGACAIVKGQINSEKIIQIDTQSDRVRALLSTLVKKG